MSSHDFFFGSFLFERKRNEHPQAKHKFTLPFLMENGFYSNSQYLYSLFNQNHFMHSDLNKLQDIFIQMNKDGFDTKNQLKWGFYFIDNKKSGLENVYKEMQDHNYVIKKFEKNNENEWLLYVSKIDILTPNKLHRRNIAFNELAEACNVKLYDGWDVEKLPL